MCIGFLPVFGMALHNWYYGGVFVLFSSHTNIAAAMPMPPSAYVSALGELLRLDFTGGNLIRGIGQIGRMLIGPSESIAMIPLHAAAFVIVFRVLLSRRYDGWLRLIAAAALGVYAPALFFIYSDRYHILAWLLTLLVCCVWARDEGLPWLYRRYPSLIQACNASLPLSGCRGGWMDLPGPQASCPRRARHLLFRQRKEAVKLGKHQRTEMQLLDERA